MRVSPRNGDDGDRSCIARRTGEPQHAISLAADNSGRKFTQRLRRVWVGGLHLKMAAPALELQFDRCAGGRVHLFAYFTEVVVRDRLIYPHLAQLILGRVKLVPEAGLLSIKTGLFGLEPRLQTLIVAAVLI
jgi:hypothetical protein